MNKKKWVAVIQGKRWTVAKIKSNKNKMKIYQLKEFLYEETVAKDSIEMSTPIPPLNLSLEEQIIALKNWIKENKIPVKKLNIALSCPGVITRMITIPVLNDKDLEMLLTEQVDQYFTLNISDYLVDYRILQKVREEEQERYRILLVAIPLSEWEKQWQIWNALGFAPKVTDLSADCLARLYSRLISKGPALQEGLEDLAIVDIGADRVEFLLLDQGVVFLYSDMEISLEEIHKLSSEYNSVTQESPGSKEPKSQMPLEIQHEVREALIAQDTKYDKVAQGTIEYQETLEVKDFQEPQEFLPKGNSEQGISGNLLETSVDNIPVDFISTEEEQPKQLELYKNEIEDRLLPIFNALSDYLTFFSARHFGKSVDKIYITGEESNLPFIESLFVKNMGIETKLGFPNDWRPVYGKNLRTLLDEQWTKYGSLYGLAMRED